MGWLVFLEMAIIVGSTVAQKDKYTDENRPYKFGFNIQGHQHRHEEKDENGIIKGEYGFITADGYYRITVYATDENGDFKIISMKNIYVGFPPEDPTTTPAPETRYGPGPKLRFRNDFSTNPTTQTPLVNSYPSTTPAVALARKTALPQLAGRVGCSNCIIPTTTQRIVASALRRDDPATRLPIAGKALQQQGRTTQYSTTPQGNRPNYSTTPQEKSPYHSTTPQGKSSRYSTTPRSPVYTRTGPVDVERPNIVEIPRKNIAQIITSNIGQIPRSNIIRNDGFSKTTQTTTSRSFSTSQTPRPVYTNPTTSSRNNYNNVIQQIPRKTTTTTSTESTTSYLNDRIINEKIQPKRTEIPKELQILSQRGPSENKTPARQNSLYQERDGLPPGVSENDIKDLLYRFNYTVGFHGHHEDGYRNGDKKGDYFFDGRDGVERKVEYIANEFGYQPNITFVDLAQNDLRRPKEETEKNFGLKGYEFKWYPRKQ